MKPSNHGAAQNRWFSAARQLNTERGAVKRRSTGDDLEQKTGALGNGGEDRDHGGSKTRSRGEVDRGSTEADQRCAKAERSGCCNKGTPVGHRGASVAAAGWRGTAVASSKQQRGDD